MATKSGSAALFASVATYRYRSGRCGGFHARSGSTSVSDKFGAAAVGAAAGSAAQPASTSAAANARIGLESFGDPQELSRIAASRLNWLSCTSVRPKTAPDRLIGVAVEGRARDPRR